MQIQINLSSRAAQKYRKLNPRTQKELDEIMNDIILTMPLEPVESAPACHDNAPSTKHSCKAGSTRKSSAPSRLLPVMLALLVLSCWSAFSQNTSKSSLVTDKLLAAVCQVESSGRATVGGDRDPRTGEFRARGAFQFWRPTWEHVTSLRRQAGLQTYSYKEGSHNLRVSREYAKSYLLWLEKYLHRHGVYTPTAGQLYMAYNCGPTSARRKGFKLKNAPAHTQRAAARIEQMIKQK